MMVKEPKFQLLTGLRWRRQVQYSCRSQANVLCRVLVGSETMAHWTTWATAGHIRLMVMIGHITWISALMLLSVIA